MELRDWELDTLWKAAVEEGNDTAVCLEAEYQRLVQESEDALAALRDFARLKAHE